MKRAALVFTFAVVSSSCAAIISIDGTRVVQVSWDDAVKTVTQLAATDLKCEASKIEVHLVHTQDEEDEPLDVIARGCNKLQNYTRDARLVSRGSHAPSHYAYGPWVTAGE